MIYNGRRRSSVGCTILPRIKIGENRMNEAVLKVERIGEVVSIIRLRLRRVLQDCSTSLREINCGRAIALLFFYAIYGRPPSRGGDGAQS